MPHERRDWSFLPQWFLPKIKKDIAMTAIDFDLSNKLVLFDSDTIKARYAKPYKFQKAGTRQNQATNTLDHYLKRQAYCGDL